MQQDRLQKEDDVTEDESTTNVILKTILTIETGSNSTIVVANH